MSRLSTKILIISSYNKLVEHAQEIKKLTVCRRSGAAPKGIRTLSGYVYVLLHGFLKFGFRFGFALGCQEISHGVDQGHVDADVAFLYQQLEVVELLDVALFIQQFDNAGLDERVRDRFVGQTARRRNGREDDGENAIIQLIIHLQSIESGMDVAPVSRTLEQQLQT